MISSEYLIVFVFSQARQDDISGRPNEAKQKANCALYLNMVAVIFHFMAAIAVLTPIIVIYVGHK